MKVTTADLEEAASKVSRLQAYAGRLKENTEAIVAEVVTAMEITITAGAFGVLRGYTGGVEVAGAPVDLLAGAASHALSLLGGAGKMRSHVAAFGDGALAAWANTLGTGIGARLKRKADAGAKAIAATAGAAQLGEGAPAFDAQLQELAARAAR